MDPPDLIQELHHYKLVKICMIHDTANPAKSIHTWIYGTSIICTIKIKRQQETYIPNTFWHICYFCFTTGELQGGHWQ